MYNNSRRGNLLASVLFVFAVLVAFLFVAQMDIPGVTGTNPVKLDTNTTGNFTGVSQGGQVNFTHTVRPVEQGRMLMVGISLTPAGAREANVTYAGENMTRMVTSENGVRTSFYRLVDPSVGNNTVNVAGFNGAVDSVVVGAATYLHVDQSNPVYFRANSTGKGGFAEVDATVNRDNDGFVDVLGVDSSDGTATPLTGQTEVWDVYVDDAVDVTGASGFTRGGDVNGSSAWELTGMNNDWSLVGVAVKSSEKVRQLSSVEQLVHEYFNAVLGAVLLLVFLVAVVDLL